MGTSKRVTDLPDNMYYLDNFDRPEAVEEDSWGLLEALDRLAAISDESTEDEDVVQFYREMVNEMICQINHEWYTIRLPTNINSDEVFIEFPNGRTTWAQIEGLDEVLLDAARATSDDQTEVLYGMTGTIQQMTGYITQEALDFAGDANLNLQVPRIQHAQLVGHYILDSVLQPGIQTNFLLEELNTHSAWGERLQEIENYAQGIYNQVYNEQTADEASVSLDEAHENDDMSIIDDDEDPEDAELEQELADILN